MMSSMSAPDIVNLSSKDWSINSEATILSLPFVPPPPRPLFLEEALSDGLTTCDLCAWAWQKSKVLSTASDDIVGAEKSEVGWVLTLIIVSVISAVLGAIIMIIFLQCRRTKNFSNVATRHNRPPIDIPSEGKLSPLHSTITANQDNGVWSWLQRRSPSTTQLEVPPGSLVENHYTHMEDAIYAELDCGSNLNRGDLENPAYTESDAPTSSAPSSAYYSDLSVSTDRAYEVVGLATLSGLDVIDETFNGDYV